MATEKFSADKVPTLVVVIPSICKSVSELQRTETPKEEKILPPLLEMKSCMKDDLLSTTKQFLDKYKLASCLDPNTEAMGFGKYQDTKKVIAPLITEEQEAKHQDDQSGNEIEIIAELGQPSYKVFKLHFRFHSRINNRLLSDGILSMP